KGLAHAIRIRRTGGVYPRNNILSCESSFFYAVGFDRYMVHGAGRKVVLCMLQSASPTATVPITIGSDCHCDCDCHCQLNHGAPSGPGFPRYTVACCNPSRTGVPKASVLPSVLGF